MVKGKEHMTTRIVTDSNGRKHITTEPLLHPSQRTWVGLTDSEKNKMAFIAGSDKHWLIRLVEDKLKEQNETT
jgi:hypothetical protein